MTRMTSTRSLHQPKSRARQKGGCIEDEREIELTMLWKQRSKEKSDWQDSESETGPEEQHRMKNICKSFYNTDMAD